MVHPCYRTAGHGIMQDDRDDALIEVAERLAAMRERSQEYVVLDYLADGWQRELELRSKGGRYYRREDGLAAPPSPSTSSEDVGRPDSCPGCGGRGGESGAPSSHGRIGEDSRDDTCRWFYQVVDSSGLDREIASVAASCLDRYLAFHAVDYRRFRLAGMTALYLAIKLHSNRKLRISCFVQMSRGNFTAAQFEETELAMLETLGWRVNPVTPRAVCWELLSLLLPSPGVEDGRGARLEIEETALFLTELSVCDYRFVTKDPSCIALAAVVLAIDLRRGSSRRNVEFLERAVGIGLGDIVYGQGIGDCYWCLRGLYHESASTGGSPFRELAERNCEPPVDRCVEISPQRLDRAMHVSTRLSTSQRHRRRSFSDAK